MTENEDFKRAIRAGNINEAFLVAMSNAPELSITTKIITAEGTVAKTQTDNCLHTHINLIEGKIENEIGEKLTGDRYLEINQFHRQQVTQGHQTIQQNLISLQKMFQLMSSFQQQQASDKHLNWVDVATDIARDALPAKSDPSQLYGTQVPNAIEAGAVNHRTDQSSLAEDEADSIVQDLLSMTDLDDALGEQVDNSADWSEWLDDEPDVETKVIDFKSPSDGDSEIWQDWESQNQALDEDLSDEARSQ
ncbi:hypothetical protein IQ255_00290 [Pleurocapsales cyanobacterium LEGE 10410]|nr:hypothetical protein [Pleurocapsales cyanobacterium LEGE 10410]